MLTNEPYCKVLPVIFVHSSTIIIKHGILCKQNTSIFI